MIDLISKIGNAFIVALSIVVGILVFYVYGEDATIGEKLAYSLIFAASIFTLFYTVKLTIIWFLKALK